MWAGWRRTSTPGRSYAPGAGLGTVAVAGIRDRASGRVSAAVAERVNGETLRGIVTDRTEEGAIVFTDDARAYRAPPRDHHIVRHSVGEYVYGMAHANGLESF